MADNPFIWLNSIMTNKQYVMDDNNEKDYPAFFVNRGLSQYIDCLMYSNEMNINSHLDHKLQYDYLFHSIRKTKRKFGKWAKRTDEDMIKAISKVYGINYRLAKEYATILTIDQIQEIMERTNG